MISKLLSCLLLASGPHWSVESGDHGWSDEKIATTYFHNSELQRQWAFEALSLVDLTQVKTLVDFGCGDGKITACMARLLNPARVVGVDLSEQMLDVANRWFGPEFYPNLTFHRLESTDFSDGPTLKCVDLITSFCVFHALPDPLPVLEKFHSLLSDKGTLLLNIPVPDNPALIRAAEEVLPLFGIPLPWEEPSGPSIRTLDGTLELLDQAQFTIQECVVIDQPTPHYDAGAMINWYVGTYSANWNIPYDIAETVFTQLLDRMIELDPEILRDDGAVLFRFTRYNIVATPTR